MTRLIWIVALCLLAGSAEARLTMFIYGPASSGGHSGGGGCSNSADFSQACNSGIAAATLGGFL
jgi:hypothetical protein